MFAEHTEEYPQLNRRHLLSMAPGSVAAGCAPAVSSDFASVSRTIGSRSVMAALHGIFDVRDFGAAGDGATLDMARINPAVKAKG
jgi:polygalacturonase